MHFLSTSRRSVIKGLALAFPLSGCVTALAIGNDGNARSVLLGRSPTRTVWDTWAIYHNDTYFVFSLTVTGDEFANWVYSTELWTSSDGVHWAHRGTLGLVSDGGVWPVIAAEGAPAKFVMNAGPANAPPDFRQTRNGPTFAESRDLVNWTLLGPEFDMVKDEQLYGSRFDGAIVAVPRPGGGYYGYFTANSTKPVSGFGFARSDDGRKWDILPPAVLDFHNPIPERSPEVSAVYLRNNRFYATVGLVNDLQHIWVAEGLSNTDIGMTLFVADQPEGPFRPAEKNRQLLAGNASYWLRFFDTPEGVLVVHHIYERKRVDDWTPAARKSYIAPLKLAEWDEEGTLRLKWRNANDAAKTSRISLASDLLQTSLDEARLTILEGRLRTGTNPTGLYIAGSSTRGTGVLVYAGGRVEYGDINPDGSDFERRGWVDRELGMRDVVDFRLVRKGRVTEFYLNDYLMQCYSLPERGTGRIGLIGRRESFSALNGWYCE